jgi:hypothetical protein
MIPERVYTVRFGNFEYKTVSSDYFSIGLRQEIIENRYAFLSATPTKAVCDMIATTPNLCLQSVRAMQTYLLEDLRIDLEAVKNLDKSVVERCVEAGRKKGELKCLLRLIDN